MKKINIICLLLCFLLIVQCVPVRAEAGSAPDMSVTNGCNTVDGAMPLLGTEPALESVGSAVLLETNTNTLMYAINADAHMYPASLVKIMTALIAFEEGTMTDAVTVTDRVLSTVPENAVSVDLVANEVMNLQDLLYCMLVGSANDAAAAIAEHIAGSQETFVSKMNQRAVELGCLDTQFTDAHGLDSKQYTTARDMTRILAEALKNRQFCEVFGAVHYDVPATNKSASRKLLSENYLLNEDDESFYYDARATGSRTGITDNGDRCIASVAEENGMQLVSVVLGAKCVYKEDGYTIKIIGGYKETSSLFDIGFDGFEAVQIFYPDQTLLQCKVENGNSDVVIGPKIAASTILPGDYSPSKLDYRYTNVRGAYQTPIEKGSKQSSVQVWYGNICVAQADLYAMNRVAAKQKLIVDLDSNKDTNVVKMVLMVAGIVIAVLLGLFGVIYVAGRMRYAAARKHSRQHRKNRRRSR